MSNETSMEELFDKIHRMQAENIVKLLESGDLSASEINAINKFLSDNNITGVRGSNKTLNRLSEALAAYDSNENVVPMR